VYLAGQGYQRRFEALQGFQQRHNFLSLSPVRDSKDGVATSEHAQVAVQSVRRMQKK
jgi:hypothetical protein